MSQMEESWNKNMADQFNPSWDNFLDKIIMDWYNNFYPEFMFVVQKPYPFGNERHTICCGINSILCKAHIFEGKERLAQLGPKLHSQLVRKVGLVIWMFKTLFSMVKYVVMDSGFVLQMLLL